jgi:hypothetical protein
MAASIGYSEVTPNQQESRPWIRIAAGCDEQGPRYSRVILALFVALNRVISSLRGIDFNPGRLRHPPMALPATYAVTNWKFWRDYVAGHQNSERQCEKHSRAPESSRIFNYLPFRISDFAA